MHYFGCVCVFMCENVKSVLIRSHDALKEKKKKTCLVAVTCCEIKQMRFERSSQVSWHSDCKMCHLPRDVDNGIK